MGNDSHGLSFYLGRVQTNLNRAPRRPQTVCRVENKLREEEGWPLKEGDGWTGEGVVLRLREVMATGHSSFSVLSYGRFPSCHLAVHSLQELS